MKKNIRHLIDFLKDKSKVNITFLIVLILLILTEFPKKDLSNDGIWYAFLRGESIYSIIKLVIGFILAFYFAISWKMKKDFKEIFAGNLLRIYCILSILILLLAYQTLPQYYDIVHVDGNDYFFTAHRILKESKTYNDRDVTQVYIEGPSNMWLQMKDSEKVYISYGITSYSRNADRSYEWGSLELDLVKYFSQKSIPITVKNREEINAKIDKYQARSDLQFWHEYMPSIMGIAD